jgi:uncharacterized iron-regulated membrane protein
MRAAVAVLHRTMGLVIAGFLIVSGLTGAVISWDHELDTVLNPRLMTAGSDGGPMDAIDLMDEVEKRDPRVRVISVPLLVEPGHSLSFFVQARVDPATGSLFVPGYNQVFVDPVTGAELGRRAWGAAWPLSRENFVSFLYKLHYSLHLPEMWGIDRWGRWLMGAIALIWTIDCFVGFWLTLPARRHLSRVAGARLVPWHGWLGRWRPSWSVRVSGTRYRLVFDLHRALGLWTWVLLFVLAFTAFSLNLYREVFYPLMSTVSQVTPNLFALRLPAPPERPIEPVVGYREIVERARAEGIGRGWTTPVGGVFYTPGFGIYGARFFEVGEEEGAAGVGPAILYFDGKDGRLVAERRPWRGTAADIFLQAQFPLHSGRILGLPGRILVSLMGVVVAALSVTGLAIWYRRHCARMAARQHPARRG